MLYDELERSCSAITPDPVSFNKCPAAMNNAGLAFDRTYTAHYPMFHELYTLLGYGYVVDASLFYLLFAWAFFIVLIGFIRMKWLEEAPPGPPGRTAGMGIKFLALDVDTLLALTDLFSRMAAVEDRKAQSET